MGKVLKLKILKKNLRSKREDIDLCFADFGKTLKFLIEKI